MNTQKWYSCSRTVVLLLFLVSCTEVRSYMTCSRDSDCDYDGCSYSYSGSSIYGTGITSYGCFYPGTYRNPYCYYCYYPGYGNSDSCSNCPERPCPVGMFNSDFNACRGRGGGTDCRCKWCPSGKYSTITGASACVDCGAGKYSTITGATVCVDCGAGTYSNATGAFIAAGCVTCGAGESWMPQAPHVMPAYPI